MQLKRLSIFTSIILTNTIAGDFDYIRINYMTYDEDNDRVLVKTKYIELNKNIGVNYNLDFSYTKDSVSGASPIYINADSSSGASAFSRGISKNSIKTNVNLNDSRDAYNFSIIKRLENRDELNLVYNNSSENDYRTNTYAIGFLHYLDKYKNQSININFSKQLNDVKNWVDSSSGASARTIKWEKSSIKNYILGFSQVIDKNSLVKIGVFYSKETGFLNNPYQTIVRDDNNITNENRPDKKIASGFNITYLNHYGKNLSIHLKYRYYDDDWKISSHTFDLMNYYEIKKIIFGIGYRYYTQKKAFFYNNKKDYFTNQKYASSDDRLGEFHSYTIKSYLEYKLDKKINLEISLNKYHQSNRFSAYYSLVGLKYSF